MSGSPREPSANSTFDRSAGFGLGRWAQRCGVAGRQAPRPEGNLGGANCVVGRRQHGHELAAAGERLGLGSAGHESFEVGIDLALLLWNHCEARLFRPRRDHHLGVAQSDAAGAPRDL
jgi:hypothetical protein